MFMWRCLPSVFALARITDTTTPTGLACVLTSLDYVPRDLSYNHCFCGCARRCLSQERRTLVAQRAANRCSPTPSPGTDVIRLEAQVRAQCDVRAGVCRLGVQKSRGGTHVRASRIMRAITQDWSAERGSRNYVLSWCVPVFF